MMISDWAHDERCSRRPTSVKIIPVNRRTASGHGFSRLLTAALAVVGIQGSVIATDVTAGGGGPPFITDDPEPVDFHHWEVYVASIHTNFGGQWAGTFPHVEVNYGAAPNLQLHVIAPWSYTAGPSQPTVFGYGATELGMKSVSYT